MEFTFEKALELAKKRKPDIDGYDEWDGGWVFSSTNDAGCQGGYGRTPVVVTRDGYVMTMQEFVFSGKAGELRRSVDF